MLSSNEGFFVLKVNIHIFKYSLFQNKNFLKHETFSDNLSKQHQIKRYMTPPQDWFIWDTSSRLVYLGHPVYLNNKFGLSFSQRNMPFV